MTGRKIKQIHKSIRERLGYQLSETDAEILKDWKSRLRRVCKPCWELKYCPYGPLVEQSPLLPAIRGESEEKIQYFRKCIADGKVGSEYALDEQDIKKYSAWLNNYELLFQQAFTAITSRIKLEYASSLETDEEMIEAFLDSNLPPIEKYRTPFEVDTPSSMEKTDYTDDFWEEIQTEISIIKEKYRLAIEMKYMDDRRPIEPARLAWFKRVVSNHIPSELPEEIPEIFYDGECNVFGHICPVFFVAEALTETAEIRKIGRHSISFATKMRVVRRDNHTCQECGKHLLDNEVEFDHIIPVSKGGSSEEHNLRLTCFDCNRDKSDKYRP